MLKHRYVVTPVGRLKLVAEDQALVAVLWPDDNPQRVPLELSGEDIRNPFLAQAEAQLQEYFRGSRTSFSMPLALRGTEFQKKVWQLLLQIPFGETRSYGELAAQLGNPAAVRAVGAANGRNPVSIFVPCHRVVGAAGSLTGFAGGLEAKQTLLCLEQAQLSLGYSAGER